jgi:hypothetical protein
MPSTPTGFRPFSGLAALIDTATMPLIQKNNKARNANSAEATEIINHLASDWDCDPSSVEIDTLFLINEYHAEDTEAYIGTTGANLFVVVLPNWGGVLFIRPDAKSGTGYTTLLPSVMPTVD